MKVSDYRANRNNVYIGDSVAYDSTFKACVNYGYLRLLAKHLLDNVCILIAKL